MSTTTDDLHKPAFMPNLLVAALARHADKPAVYLGDEVLTASQVAAQMSKYVQAFASLGIGAHHPIAMLAKNRPEVLFTMGANMLTPCRSTSLHPMGSADDQAYVLEDAEIETLVFDPSAFEERAAELRDRVPGLKALLSLGPSEVGIDLIALAETFEPKPLVAPDVDGEDISGFTYTGGTTGASKGVMQTYRSGATLTQIQLAEWEWPEETRFLIATPLSHAGAAFFVPTLLRGGSIVVLPGFDPTAVLETIQKYKITATMLVPTMLYILMDHPKIDEYDLSSLETVYYGASAISPTRLKEAIEKFGSIFFQFFGQSECGMTISVLRKGEHDIDDMARLATCGRPVPWLNVKLLDDELNEVPDGEPGEICVRGPLVMAGYWNKPEQTAEALAGGWLHTGDIAKKDSQGFLTIVDRKKDMIVSGGFNVFPREIEDVVGTHPAVAQVAVIGVPDDKWGEAVKAVVVLRPGQTVTEQEIYELVKERKGATHAPKSVDFVEAIPLSALGKPDKKALRAQYWDSGSRMVN
ncbi:MAG TPA: AMP-binding protein [Mycobacteriales bacterium]|nr:AMP-binding protein [Mycobacteriales bacterium]